VPDLEERYSSDHNYIGRCALKVHQVFGLRMWLLAALSMLLLVAMACGSSDTAPVIIEKEIIKEVPVEVIVEKEIIKEVIVEKEVVIEKEVTVYEAKPQMAEGAPAFMALGSYGGVVPMGSWCEGSRLDIHKSASMCDSSKNANVWNNLVVHNPEDPNEIVGELVKTWEMSDDLMTYSFQLVDNATWWDGKPVTAHDVKYSIDRMGENKTKGIARGRVDMISNYVKEVEVIDDHSFKFHLKFPGASALFPFLAVEYTKIYPKHVFEGIDLGSPERDFKEEEIVGSGSFKSVKWVRGSFQEFERVDNYWKSGMPFWDGYTVTPIREPQRVIAAFRADQVLMWNHAWPGLAIKDYIALSKELKDRWTFHFLPPSGGVGWRVNINRKPFSDWRARKAFYLAIDRKAVVDGWVFGYGREGAPFVPGTWMSAPDEEMWTWPGHRYVDAAGNPVKNPYDSNVPVFKDPQDIEEAKRLLAEAGYPEGIEDVKMIFSASTEEGAFIVANALKQVGIKPDLYKPGSGGEWVKLVRTDQAFDITHSNYSLTIMEPDDILGGMYLTGGSRNLQNWEDPKFTELAEAQRRIVDRTERRKVLKQLEDMIRGEVDGVMPAWVQTVWGKFVVWPVHKHVQNFTPCFTLQQCNHFEHLWLTEEGASEYK